MSRHSEKQEALQGAMASLLPNTNFQEFLEVLRDLREAAVAYAISHDTIKDQRNTLAALGEVRAYDDILGIAKAHEQVLDQSTDQVERLD